MFQRLISFIADFFVLDFYLLAGKYLNDGYGLFDFTIRVMLSL